MQGWVSARSRNLLRSAQVGVSPPAPGAGPSSPAQCRADSGSQLGAAAELNGEHRYGGVKGGLEPHGDIRGGTPLLEMEDVGGDGGDGGPGAPENLLNRVKS